MDRYRNCVRCRVPAVPVRAGTRPTGEAFSSGAGTRSAENEKYGVTAISLIDFQPFGGLYSPEEGLKHGTIFSGLNKPLRCGGCGR